MKHAAATEKLQEYFSKHREDLLQQYFTFLRFPSISSEPPYAKDVQNCAQWVKNFLQNIGFQTELWPTSGHPAIFASSLEAGPSQPTLLIYNHYDVQPVDPLELWETPPFEPTVRNGEVYARGAQDNKGQCFYTLCALKALREIHGKFPVNIKIVVEGEEECGSKGLAGVLSQHKQQLAADYLAVIDMGLPSKDIPAVTLGIRGLVAMEMTVTGSSTDMHSGSHGGIAYNPNRAIAELIASLYSPDGSVAVPGFYKNVKEVPKDILDNLYQDFDAEKYHQSFSAHPTGGESHLPPVQRATLRPTIEVNGLWGGYIGEGFKTVIPAKARAKISCRLVPDMEPYAIGKLVADYLQSKAPPGMHVEVKIIHGGGTAVRAEADSKVVKAFSDAYSEVFNKPCTYIFEGGSIPIITELSKASNSQVVLLGMGLAEDAIHAPNEHFGLDRIEQGFLVVARAIELLNQI